MQLIRGHNLRCLLKNVPDLAPSHLRTRNRLYISTNSKFILMLAFSPEVLFYFLHMEDLPGIQG
jgi:hypothetical protein